MLSESPELNSDASTLLVQALVTQFIKQKCEPLTLPYVCVSWSEAEKGIFGAKPQSL